MHIYTEAAALHCFLIERAMTFNLEVVVFYVLIECHTRQGASTYFLFFKYQSITKLDTVFVLWLACVAFPLLFCVARKCRGPPLRF